MFTIHNNEGKEITVDQPTFNQLASEYNKGVWCAICKDIAGNIHSVIFPDNF